ncbi:MAG TPA: DUF4215 domain-containing protein, partial [Kofleriaceae bacterium]|nr:DUF4215 domain-containing protein [Kofleriaceae bacterium]
MTVLRRGGGIRILQVLVAIAPLHACAIEFFDQQRAIVGCGNGLIDRDEVCDDGNTVSGDGCSADCKSTEICGNLILDIAAGEVCDDGNHVSGDGCRADCRSTESCGNRIIDVAVGEICDDGNHAAHDGCSADCKSD